MMDREIFGVGFIFCPFKCWELLITFRCGNKKLTKSFLNSRSEEKIYYQWFDDKVQSNQAETAVWSMPIKVNDESRSRNVSISGWQMNYRDGTTEYTAPVCVIFKFIFTPPPKNLKAQYITTVCPSNSHTRLILRHHIATGCQNIS